MPLEAKPRDVSGSYWCTLGEEGFDGERYACVIKRVGDRVVLAKLDGEQRIRGHIKLDDKEGFSFVGEFYCLWDECQQELHGRFTPEGRGGFKGTFREEAIEMHLTPAPAGSFGGNTYGGDEYGGAFDYRPKRPAIPMDGVDLRGRRRP